MSLVKSLHRFLLSLLWMAGIIILFNGCNHVCGGLANKLDCYNEQRKFIGSFCVNEKPPCKCFKSDGTTDQLKEFGDPCDPNISTDGVTVPIVGQITIVDEPYKFDCPTLFNSSLCSEYDVYYFDQTTAGVTNFRPPDYDYRPVYLRFEIDNFDITKFAYSFNIHSATNELIDYVQISNGQVSEDVIRFLEPTTCTGPCDVIGTVKLDIMRVRRPGIYRAAIEKVDYAEPRNPVRTELTSTTFEVKNVDGNSSSRIFNFVVYKHSLLDLSSYSTDDLTFNGPEQSGILHFVFGKGHSNLRFNNETKAIAKPYVDDFSNAMLDGSLLAPTSSGISRDLKPAVRAWIKKVYLNVTASSIYRGFGMEVGSLRRYDFTVNPPKEDASVRTLIDDNIDFVGITSVNEATAFEDYFNGCLIIRDKVSDEIGILGETIPRVDEYSLCVFMHELGHMWSPAATSSVSGTNCDQHEGLGNGRKFHYCMWHCPEPGTLESHIKQLLDNPTYCEGHQHVFMNQLRVRF